MISPRVPSSRWPAGAWAEEHLRPPAQSADDRDPLPPRPPDRSDGARVRRSPGPLASSGPLDAERDEGGPDLLPRGERGDEVERREDDADPLDARPGRPGPLVEARPAPSRG